VHDDTEVNVRAFDPRRFGSYASHEWIVEKSKEDYQVRHDTPVPDLQRPALRPWRKSSIHARLEAHGAVFGEVHGYERPRWFARDGGPDLSPATAVGSRLQNGDANGWRRQPWFETVGEECRRVRERVGLFDLMAFTKIEVTGRNAKALLARLVANRLPKRNGGIVLAHALTRAGTIDSEFTITRIDADRFYLCSSAIAELKDLDRLRFDIREGEDVHIENLSSSWGCIMIAGPKTRDVLEIGTDADLSGSAFRWLTGRNLALFDTRCRLLRVSYTGELGFEIHLPVEHMLSVYDALWEAGKPHGIVDFGSHALNSLRMEKGYKGGTELTSEVTLPEADMLRFADFDKDDFIGKAATLSRIQKGLRWLLVYLEVDSSGADCVGTEPVYAGDRKIGTTSSGGYGYATEKSFAFAYVDPDYATPDTEVAVQILGDKHRARILGTPAYDPENARLRS
jgi:dimethylglycine dehydrogenase